MTLIEKLEAAQAGSRELDAEIVAKLNSVIVRQYPPSTDFGPSSKWQFWSEDGKHFLGNESKFPVPPYTTSLDSALTLVPKGEIWEIGKFQKYENIPLPRPKAGCPYRAWVGVDGPFCWAPTPALALTIACLKARQ